MFLLDADCVACFDVDETLVKFQPDGSYVPHEKHIRELKNHATRGHYIIVWSKGGCNWASRIVEELGLREYVDICGKKPDWIYDDKPLNYLADRVYHEDK